MANMSLRNKVLRSLADDSCTDTCVDLTQAPHSIPIIMRTEYTFCDRKVFISAPGTGVHACKGAIIMVFVLHKNPKLARGKSGVVMEASYEQCDVEVGDGTSTDHQYYCRCPLGLHCNSILVLLIRATQETGNFSLCHINIKDTLCIEPLPTQYLK